MNFSEELKNTWPTTVYVRVSVSSSYFGVMSMYCPTLLAKNSAASNTPAKTPNAKLCVATTTTTVTTMTMLVDNGCSFRFLIEPQLKVPIETMIITATKAAMGICTSHLSSTSTMISRKIPADNVDRRVLPPDLILIMDWPIIAQPAMPPRSPEPMLAMP